MGHPQEIPGAWRQPVGCGNCARARAFTPSAMQGGQAYPAPGRTGLAGMIRPACPADLRDCLTGSGIRQRLQAAILVPAHPTVPSLCPFAVLHRDVSTHWFYDPWRAPRCRLLRCAPPWFACMRAGPGPCTPSETLREIPPGTQCAQNTPLHDSVPALPGTILPVERPVDHDFDDVPPQRPEDSVK